MKDSQTTPDDLRAGRDRDDIDAPILIEVRHGRRSYAATKILPTVCWNEIPWRVDCPRLASS